MNKTPGLNIDWGLLIPTFVLLVLSLITLSALNMDFFRNQAIFSAVAILFFLFFSQTNYKVLKLYGFPIYIVSLIFLLAVLVIGTESRGATRWVELFGGRLQFSEFFKPFLAISLASFLSDRKNSTFGNLFSVLVFMLPVVFLIYLQPDLGNALIYVFVTILTLILFGFPLRFFLTGLVFLSLITPIFWKFLRDYQKERILTFLNPEKDPLGTSYNAIQSVIAVGSGMILGKGLGQGTQSGLRFLPERHTDFIFATISEQLGFVGSIVILASFAFIILRILKIYNNSNDSFPKIFAGISFFIILVQVFVNVGMNVGLLPVVGVTLPFVSYGGSSLLSSFILLGLLSSVGRSEKEEGILEIK